MVQADLALATDSSARLRSRNVLFAVVIAAALLLVMTTDALALGRWTIVPSPNVAGEAFTSLGGVSCPDPTHCVAVGAAVDSSDHEITLIEQASPQTNWS